MNLKKIICHAKLTLFVSLLSLPSSLFSFGSGFVFNLRAEFGGSLTIPSITEAALKDLNPMATAMTGTMSGLLNGVEAEVGYVFRSPDYFGLSKTNPFSGLGVFGSLGFSEGNASQKITVDVSGTEMDMFMNVDYLPVVAFGLKGKAYFFNQRLALGLGVGGKLIADVHPGFLVYSTHPEVIPTEIGTIIVTEKMMQKMNPFMVTVKFLAEYNITMIETMEFIVGFWLQGNMYRPMYLTMPPSLVKLAKDNNPNFDIDKKQPDYWLNTMDFGINLGIGFKL